MSRERGITLISLLYKKLLSNVEKEEIHTLANELYMVERIVIPDLDRKLENSNLTHSDLSEDKIIIQGWEYYKLLPLVNNENSSYLTIEQWEFEINNKLPQVIKWLDNLEEEYVMAFNRH